MPSKIIDDNIAAEAIQSADLNLSDFDQITDNAASLLLKSKVFKLITLQLNALAGLLDDCSSLWSAEDVASTYFTRTLTLDGLTSLSPTAARQLAKITGYLSLNGLKNMPECVAESLSKHKGFLSLDGLEEITNEVAAILSKHGGYLCLNGLRHLSDEAAKYLGTYPGDYLSLNGLESIADEAAAKLVILDKKVLDGREGIYDVPPEVYTSFTGNLFLNGLRQLSESAAKSLARTWKSLSLNGLTRLSGKYSVPPGSGVRGRGWRGSSGGGGKPGRS